MNETQKTDLIRYAPYVLGVTLLVVGLPLLLAYALSGPLVDLPFFLTTLASTALSVVIGRGGARLWQNSPRARDVVFYDLTVWGFLRRLWHQRWVLHHAERMAVVDPMSRSASGQGHLKILKKLARALESGDPYTHGHSNRVAAHAYMVARTLKLPKRTCEKIRLAAALHDVGKLHTPREILTKPGRLTDEEFEVVKLHPVDGAAMVAELEDDELTKMVSHHHERIDGTGYPHRASGNEIPIGARIISVVDTFDAITSLRPYRANRSHKDAIQILQKEAGAQLDASCVQAFITYYTGKRGIRRWMSLTSGMPSLFDFSIAGLQRAATHAAVVATSAAVVAGSPMLPGLGNRAVASIPKALAQTSSDDNGRSLLITGEGEATTKSTRSKAASKSERVKGRQASGREEEAREGKHTGPQDETPGDGSSDETSGDDSGSTSGSNGNTGVGNGQGHGNGNSNGGGSGNASANANANGGGSGNASANANANGGAGGDPNANANANAGGSGNPNANANANAKS